MENDSVINHEYDYSNCLPTIEYVSYLVKYLDELYKNFIKLIEQEEKNNKQYKLEYRNYNYKNSYGQQFEIYIKEKTFNNITCKDFQTFESATQNGNLTNVKGIHITLDLDFKRGKGTMLEEHENSFHVVFQPYEIKFTRKSNYKDSEMDKIEDAIKQILGKFPVINTVFCTK